MMKTKSLKNMWMAVFWVVAPCNLVEVCLRFRHGATNQKTAIFLLMAVRTLNPI
jgi:hypothetical protein